MNKHIKELFIRTNSNS